MDQRIKPKPNRSANIIYGDVHEADEVVQGTIERIGTKTVIRNLKPIPDVVEEIPILKPLEEEPEKDAT